MMKTLALSLCLALAVSTAGSALAAPVAAHSWDVYGNGRFDYRICYPSDLFTPQPEADNGDGRVFTAASGASLTVWGNYDESKRDIGAIAADTVEPDAAITYRRLTKTSAVLSGRKKGNIFYAKVLRGKKDADTIRTFILSYPESQAALYDPIAAKLSACFVAGE